MNITPEPIIEEKQQIIAEIKKEKHLLKKQKMHNGHKMFEINLKDFTIAEAELTSDAVVHPNGKTHTKTKVIWKNEIQYLYMAALNYKNVERILKRGGIRGNFQFIRK